MNVLLLKEDCGDDVALDRNNNDDTMAKMKIMHQKLIN